MAYYDIHKALTQSLIDLSLDVPIAHENVDFDPLGFSSLLYDAQTANFTLDLVITGVTSGATAIIEVDVDSGATGVLTLKEVVGTFKNNEIITDTSTGSATVDGVLITGSVTQFIDVTMIPAATEVISKDTLDEELGIYQISIYTRSGDSVKTAYELADIIALNYIHGLELTSGTQKIFIDNTSRNAGRNSNGWFIIDLSVNYIADLLR